MTADTAATTGTSSGLNQLRKLDTTYSPGSPPTVSGDPGTTSRSLEFATLLDRAAAVDRRRDTGMSDRRRPGTPEVIGRRPVDPGPTTTTPAPTPRIDRPPVDRVTAGRSRQPDSDRRTTSPDRTTRADRADRTTRADRADRDEIDPVDRDAAAEVEGPDTGADDDPTSEPTTPDGGETQVVTAATVVTTTPTAPTDGASSGADSGVSGALDDNAYLALDVGADGPVQAIATSPSLGVGSEAVAGTAATGEEVPATGPTENEGTETASETAPTGAESGGADLAPTTADPDLAVEPAPADPTAGASSGSGHEGGTHDGGGQGHRADPEPTSTPAPVPATIVTGAAAAAAFGATISGLGGAGEATKPTTAGDGPQSALSGPPPSDLDLGLVPTSTGQTTISGSASAESGAGAPDPVWHQVQRALNTVRLNAAGDHELTIRLRPEELGSVLVTVTTGEAGTTVSLTADSRAAASQLLAQRHLLLDQLQDSGLGGATVDVGLGDTSGRSDSGPGTARDNESRSALAAVPDPGPRAEHQPQTSEVARPRSGTSARVDLAL